MTLIDEKPEGIPTTNALDGIDVEEPGPSEIRLGGMILTMLDDPPGLGGRVKLGIEVELTELCVRKNASGDDDGDEDGEIVHYLKSKLVGCWELGKKRTGRNDDPNQPALVDVHDPDDDAAPDGAE